jgi:hypothetical protein
MILRRIPFLEVGLKINQSAIVSSIRLPRIDRFLLKVEARFVT